MKGFIENIKFRFFKLIHRCKKCRRNAYICWYIKKGCLWNEEEKKIEEAQKNG